MKRIIPMLLATFIALNGIAQEQKLDNIFYCFNNGVRGLPHAPETLEGQAALIKKLGFNGLAGHHTQDNLALRAALDKRGLLMPEVYYGMSIDKSGRITYSEALAELIRKSEDRKLMVALTLHANHANGHNSPTDSMFVPEIRKLADFAGKYGVEIALYPHINFYLEESMHALKLAREVDHPNVGVIFNTCHFLKVESEEGWEKKLKESLPYLKMVSINGADSGDTKQMGWDQLIQPLGEGTFDTYKFVKFLKDLGYEGMFGLQCYNIKQDCEVALAKSISTWRSYQKRIENE